MGNTIQLPVPTIIGEGEVAKTVITTFDLPCDTEEVSDTFHTFGELYRQRFMLFCAFALMMSREYYAYVWKSQKHWIEGELKDVWPGWFLAGVRLDPSEAPPGENVVGQMITYHLPMVFWPIFIGDTEETPPPHDGHTSLDVLLRLNAWIIEEATGVDYRERQEIENYLRNEREKA